MNNTVEKRVSILFSISLLISMFTNYLYLKLYAIHDSYECGREFYVTIIVLFISFLFSYGSVIKNNKITKIFQILSFIIISVYSTLINDLSNPTGIIFLIFPIILIWIYGNFKSKPLLIVPIFIVFYVFFRVLKIFIAPFVISSIGLDVSTAHTCQNVSDHGFIMAFLNIVDGFNFIILLFLFFKITLFKEILLYFEKSKNMENELLKNEPYVWYGKNVTGVIHNIKNKITPIYLLLGEVEGNQDIDKNIREFAKTQIENSDNISKLLDQLLYIVKNKNTEELKFINISEIVFSVVEFFKANLEFKNSISVKIDTLYEDLIIYTKPFQLVQVIENIIKNSWDEIRSKKGDKNIFITINSKEKTLSIMDNGSGINNCINCKDKKCFNSCDKFKIGKSSKENGLGYGMLFIENYIKENNFKGLINSTDAGTEIIIYFK